MSVSAKLSLKICKLAILVLNLLTLFVIQCGYYDRKAGMGKNLSPPKKKRKFLWKRSAKPAIERSLRAKVGDPAQPTLENKEFESPHLKGHEIMRVRNGSPTLLATAIFWVSRVD